MTFIPFPDISAVSPDGKYRLEIKGKPADDFFRDQSGFVYQLFEGGERNKVWDWRPDEQDGLADYPQEAWVSDDGWVVVLPRNWFSSGLLAISPHGESRLLCAIRSLGQGEPGFLDDEPDFHIGHSSAGPFWYASSFGQFHQFNRRNFWSLLTWWGRRVLLDLDEGTIVDNVPSEQIAIMTRKERAWIIEELKRGSIELQSEPCNDSLLWNRVGHSTYTAAYHAGRSRVSDAVPFLRMLEDSPVIGYTTWESWMHLAQLRYRLIAKISLLRIGVEPQWIANFIVENTRTKERIAYSERRRGLIDTEIVEGMSQQLMLEKVGVPEFMRRKWDYGIWDGKSAHTVRVHWHDRHKEKIDWQNKEAVAKYHERHRRAIEDDPPVAERVERIDQPPWAADSLREYEIAHNG
jgi:hypothetical protein